jgi:hypothetical protein
MREKAAYTTGFAPDFHVVNCSAPFGATPQASAESVARIFSRGHVSTDEPATFIFREVSGRHLPSQILRAAPIVTEPQIPSARGATSPSPPRPAKLTWSQPSGATNVNRGKLSSS